MIFMLMWLSAVEKWECCGGGVNAAYGGGLVLLRFSVGAVSGCGGVNATWGGGSGGLGLLWLSTVAIYRYGGGVYAPCGGGRGGLGWF
ncbi:Hypothetical predicted protein [Olea europaea subsp. europaea]|uniref:Uncharacterized protein n=1 Tax=Olea europaea subsp. europaea TaxID=158383 RepID=A0A8S0USA6_OLEEU|nr:Hypothetical predicted protein [Olea europaea subsp. europaea]